MPLLELGPEPWAQLCCSQCLPGPLLHFLSREHVGIIDPRFREDTQTCSSTCPGALWWPRPRFLCMQLESQLKGTSSATLQCYPHSLISCSIPYPPPPPGWFQHLALLWKDLPCSTFHSSSLPSTDSTCLLPTQTSFAVLTIIQIDAKGILLLNFYKTLCFYLFWYWRLVSSPLTELRTNFWKEKPREK